MAGSGRNRQSATPSVHGILIVDSPNLAMTAVVTDRLLTGRDLTDRSRFLPSTPVGAKSDLTLR
jgi:hypothetical protein